MPWNISILENKFIAEPRIESEKFGSEVSDDTGYAFVSRAIALVIRGEGYYNCGPGFESQCRQRDNYVGERRESPRMIELSDYCYFKEKTHAGL